MNIFVVIERVKDFQCELVDYYSVRYEDSDLSEFDKFLTNHETDENIKEELEYLFVWLEKLGNEIGAKEEYFRYEQQAGALPPPAKFLTSELRYNLRLYCMRLTNDKVILFNGAVKTANRAQDCPNVGPKFRDAVTFAQKLNKLIVDKDLSINELDGKEFDI